MDKDGNKDQQPFKITGNWKEQCQKLKEEFSHLKDSDLMFEKGKEAELLGRLENKLSKNREEVIKILNNTQFS
ncbi:uncharacterized protein YjbJ (UPF0337 family) [Chryseobacterium ginsenosidimutans]|uniref:hypothetical protein n=1 Tax=Chryseobacterium ginsenosidimutans TaxID=687846 RepID=UPI002166C819|nr:hypothetical protein [Chryseobacterium ginsenosidimutans]MCS3869266.1 uncharacterized protein YjbJ (UPF0337 family) [Chryseobacterium ginsenosidimutans]